MKLYTLGLALTALAVSSGCPTMTVCNGTGETIIVETFGIRSSIEPCECNSNVPADTILTISDLSGNTLTNPAVVGFLDSFTTFNGFEITGSEDAPDFSTKSTIVFRNESSESIDMLPQSADLVPGPHTLVPPGGTRLLVTNRAGAADFLAGGSPEIPSATCVAAIVDGLEIIWDGENLTCGVAPPPPPPAEAQIDLCNMDPFEFALPVFMFIRDEEAADLETQVSKDSCRTVTVPTGMPVTIVVRDIEDVVQLGECTLNEPGAGDMVVWDGMTVTCIESAAAELEPIADPFPESQPNPFEQLAVEGIRREKYWCGVRGGT